MIAVCLSLDKLEHFQPSDQKCMEPGRQPIWTSVGCDQR